MILPLSASTTQPRPVDHEIFEAVGLDRLHRWQFIEFDRLRFLGEDWVG